MLISLIGLCTFLLGWPLVILLYFTGLESFSFGNTSTLYKFLKMDINAQLYLDLTSATVLGLSEFQNTRFHLIEYFHFLMIIWLFLRSLCQIVLVWLVFDQRNLHSSRLFSMYSFIDTSKITHCIINTINFISKSIFFRLVFI